MEEAYLGVVLHVLHSPHCSDSGSSTWTSGVWVTAVCPGPVDTEFFDIAEKYGSSLAVKRLTMVSAERVVREALAASGKRKEVSVCSLPIQAFQVLSKTVPHSWIMGLMSLLK